MKFRWKARNVTFHKSYINKRGSHVEGEETSKGGKERGIISKQEVKGKLEKNPLHST